MLFFFFFALTLTTVMALSTEQETANQLNAESADVTNGSCVCSVCSFACWGGEKWLKGRSQVPLLNSWYHCYVLCPKLQSPLTWIFPNKDHHQQRHFIFGQTQKSNKVCSILKWWLYSVHFTLTCRISNNKGLNFLLDYIPEVVCHLRVDVEFILFHFQQTWMQLETIFSVWKTTDILLKLV